MEAGRRPSRQTSYKRTIVVAFGPSYGWTVWSRFDTGCSCVHFQYRPFQRGFTVASWAAAVSIRARLVRRSSSAPHPGANSNSFQRDWRAGAQRGQGRDHATYAPVADAPNWSRRRISSSTPMAGDSSGASRRNRSCGGLGGMARRSAAPTFGTSQHEQFTGFAQGHCGAALESIPISATRMRSISALRSNPRWAVR